jgi:redox-sensitive bicupin YhaK (pirin superfamily)
VARGTLDVNGHSLKEGDGLAIAKEESLTLAAKTPSEILLFDLQ